MARERGWLLLTCVGSRGPRAIWTGSSRRADAREGAVRVCVCEPEARRRIRKMQRVIWVGGAGRAFASCACCLSVSLSLCLSVSLKAPRLSEAMCRRKECRGACGGSLNGGDRSGEAQLRELGHTCPDELSRAAAVSGNRSLIYICGSVCLYRFS